MQNNVFCPKCKTENPEGSKFCNCCGDDLTKIIATIPSPAEMLLAKVAELNLLVNGFVDERDGNWYPVKRYGSSIWIDSDFRFEGSGTRTVEGEDAKFFAEEFRWNAGNPQHRFKKLAKTRYTYEGAKKGCPKGWHLPTLDEVAEFIKFSNNKRAVFWCESDTIYGYEHQQWRPAPDPMDVPTEDDFIAGINYDSYISGKQKKIFWPVRYVKNK